MSPMEQLAKQEYERGYSDGKSDYFAAGVAEGEMRARQRMIANRVVANQHPFAASGKPIADQAEQSSEAATPTTLAEPVALLQLAEDALVYHTEQTRPIQNTIDALAAIQKFKEKQR